MTFLKEDLKQQINGMDLQQVRTTLLKYCFSLTGSLWDAEDLAQETCLKAMPIIKGALEHENGEAYLYRIAKNVWIDKVRRQRISDKFVSQQIPQDEHSPGLMGIDVEIALGVLIRELSPLQRTVFLLREVFGFTSARAAEMLKTTDGAVKAALLRARSSLNSINQEDKFMDERVDESSHKEFIKAYVSAIQQGDAPLLVQLMHNDLVDSVMATSMAINHKCRKVPKEHHNKISWKHSNISNISRDIHLAA